MIKKEKAAKMEQGEDDAEDEKSDDEEDDEDGADEADEQIGVPPAGVSRFCIVRFSKDIQFGMPNRELYN